MLLSNNINNFRLGRQFIGIDVSPTACKLMAKRIHYKKDEIVGMKYTIEELKELPPFEFQNWVVAELRGKASKRKVWDMGIDGYLDKDLFHDRIGIQVKQFDKIGRGVIDNFETSLERGKFKNGFVVGFSFTKGAKEEVARVKKERKLNIRLITVEELLDKRKILFE